MANKVVSGFQTESDVEAFTKARGKQFRESAPEGALNDHLGQSRTRRVFPDDQSAMKVVYRVMRSASKKWTMSIRNWKPVLNRFTIEFGERVTAHL